MKFNDALDVQKSNQQMLWGSRNFINTYVPHWKHNEDLKNAMTAWVLMSPEKFSALLVFLSWEKSGRDEFLHYLARGLKMKGRECAGFLGLATSQHGTVNHTQSPSVSVKMTSTIIPILTGRSYVLCIDLVDFISHWKFSSRCFIMR